MLSQISRIVIEYTHVCGGIHQVVIIAAEAGGQFNKTSAREENGIVADAQDLYLLHQVVGQGVVQVGGSGILGEGGVDRGGVVVVCQ